MLPVLSRPVDPASVLVEHDDVEVDLVPGVVAQDEIPDARVGTRHRRVSTTLQNGNSHRYVALLDDDVDVAVISRPRSTVITPLANVVLATVSTSASCVRP